MRYTALEYKMLIKKNLTYTKKTLFIYLFFHKGSTST